MPIMSFKYKVSIFQNPISRFPGFSSATLTDIRIGTTGGASSEIEIKVEIDHDGDDNDDYLIST